MGAPAGGGAAPQVAPPDGGWGWAVVFASFMIHVFADGMTYSFGVFYNEFLIYFDEGKGATAWIGSMLVGVTLCAGPVSSALVNRYGCREVTIGGSVLASLALMVSSFATNIPTLYITVGFLTGLGLGLMYLPAIVCVTIYFEKYRSLATGIAVCGSGLGTFLMAPLTELLVSNYSWRGAFLLIGALMLNCIVFGILFRPLLPPPPPPPLIQVEEGNLAAAKKEEAVAAGGRPQSVHGLSSQLEETRRLAASQPLLLQQERRPSHHRSAAGLMYRKDVFYTASTTSLANLTKSAPGLADMEKEAKEEETALVEANGTGRKDLQEANSHKGEEDSAVTLCGMTLPKETGDTLREMLDFSLLKDPIFIIFTVSNFCTSIGFNVPYIYLIAMSTERAVDPWRASLLLSVIGIANTIGRIILGYISDKPYVNRLNVYIVCLTIAGFGTALCSLCESFVSFVIYSAVYGFTIGAYVGLTSVILVDLLGLDKLTNAFGILLLFQGIASLVGPPITGWLYDATKSYNPGFVMSGLVMAASGLILFVIPPLRRHLDKR